MKIRRVLAINAAKLVCAVSKRIGKQGATWAGKVAMLIYPSILKELSADVKKKIYAVCGTNGKTSTNKMICSALELEDNKVICNHTGANMLNGVAAAFVLAADKNGTLDADYACIEVDEASAKIVFPHIKPDFMVITNLFRDQLDRYGQEDATAQLLSDAIKAVPDMKIIVNADEVVSTSMVTANKNSYITYGVNKEYSGNQNESQVIEGKFCKLCGEKLDYNFYHYSQLGDYSCPKCGFKRPHIDYNAEDIYCQDYIEFSVSGIKLRADYRGFYNIYNILAAFTALSQSGEKLNNFQKMLDNYNPGNGRMELFEIYDTKVNLNLAKNPAGFNQSIAAVMQDKTKKDIIISVNDKDQDGIDVTWIWDVDFLKLSDPSVNSITVSGIRNKDMLLRLKYEDINAKAEDDIDKAIREKVLNGCKNLYVIVNFTALLSTRTAIKQLEEEQNEKR
ncbi:MAG: MurT ligase domain-containing protein [Clostridia bacterium]|nr:MurT ligase domain-containing protein [Clostridia bacterium]